MNNVLGQTDKKRGRLYPSRLIQGFQETIEDCELVDMELHGYPYTFERSHGTDVWIEIRLDRALVSKSWIDSYQEAKLTNLEVSTSDHCPILLEPMVDKLIVSSRKFRFENAWLREPMCEEIVDDLWARHRTENLQSKLRYCAESLSTWGQEVTGNFRKRISHCKKIIKASKGHRDEVSVRQFQEESKKLNEIYTQQEVFWKQRSKQLWLREGDHNSKFFHQTAKARRKTN